MTLRLWVPGSTARWLCDLDKPWSISGLDLGSKGGDAFTPLDCSAQPGPPRYRVSAPVCRLGLSMGRLGLAGFTICWEKHGVLCSDDTLEA